MALRHQSLGARREMSTGSVLRRELTGGSMSSRRSVRDRQSMQRVIVKQGYLKKLPDSTKFGAAFKKPERRWFIFGVICNRDPYLEYFENEESIFTNTPLKMIFLDECTTVTRNQKTSRFTNIFTLVLKNRQLSLIAQTRDSMLEWCRAIEDKLYSLGVIGCVGGDNDYLIIPPVSILRQRQSIVGTTPPTSSPVQTNDSPSNARSNPDEALNGACSSNAEQQNAENVENAQFYENFSYPDNNSDSDQACVSMPEIMMTGRPTSRGSSLDTRPSRLSYLQPPENAYLVPITPAGHPHNLISLNNDTPPRGTFRNASSGATANGNHFTVTTGSSRAQESDSSDDEEIFVPVMTHVHRQPMFSPSSSGPLLPSYTDSMSNPSSPSIQSPVYENPPPPLPVQSNSFDMLYLREQRGAGVDSGGSAAELPPPYLSPRLLERGANNPLKVTQVQDLKTEIGNSTGVTVVIDKDQCWHSIALVECFQKVWIVGWNQRSFPLLCAQLHIGDQLMSVNGTPVFSAKSAKKKKVPTATLR